MHWIISSVIFFLNERQEEVLEEDEATTSSDVSGFNFLTFLMNVVSCESSGFMK
jgi:hypothetical protein